MEDSFLKVGQPTEPTTIWTIVHVPLMKWLKYHTPSLSPRRLRLPLEGRGRLRPRPPRHDHARRRLQRVEGGQPQRGARLHLHVALPTGIHLVRRPREVSPRRPGGSARGECKVSALSGFFKKPLKGPVKEWSKGYRYRGHT